MYMKSHRDYRWYFLPPERIYKIFQYWDTACSSAQFLMVLEVPVWLFIAANWTSKCHEGKWCSDCWVPPSGVPSFPGSWPFSSWLSCWPWTPSFVSTFLWEDKSAAQLFCPLAVTFCGASQPFRTCHVRISKCPEEIRDMECWAHVNEFLFSLGSWSCKSWLCWGFPMSSNRYITLS